MFSTRVPADLRPNRLTLAVQAERARGGRLIDLTETNPTRVGIPYRRIAGGATGRVPGRLRYEPHPFGLAAAREAVAAEYAAAGVLESTRRASCSPPARARRTRFSSSCSATRATRCSCRCPATRCSTTCRGSTAWWRAPYPLEYHGTWSADVDAIERRNLAAHAGGPDRQPEQPDRLAAGRATNCAALASLCAAGRLALIGDEVFADYLLRSPAGPGERPRAGRGAHVRLGGLSKSAGLPQMKLGWMVAARSRGAWSGTALARLEVVADAYLSVSTPVQQAAGALLAAGTRRPPVDPRPRSSAT